MQHANPSTTSSECRRIGPWPNATSYGRLRAAVAACGTSWRYRLGTPPGRVAPVRRPRLRSGLFSVWASNAWALWSRSARVEFGKRSKQGVSANAEHDEVQRIAGRGAARSRARPADRRGQVASARRAAFLRLVRLTSARSVTFGVDYSPSQLSLGLSARNCHRVTAMNRAVKPSSIAMARPKPCSPASTLR